jgi:hypothetical protein
LSYKSEFNRKSIQKKAHKLHKTPDVTLETLVWGKPAKRGLYCERPREVTAAKIWKFLTKISSNLSHSSAKNGPAKLLYNPGTMHPVLPSKYTKCTTLVQHVRPVLFQPSTACTTTGWYCLCTAWLPEVFGLKNAAILDLSSASLAAQNGSDLTSTGCSKLAQNLPSASTANTLPSLAQAPLLLSLAQPHK